MFISSKKRKLVQLAAALVLLGTVSFGAMAEWVPIGQQNNEITIYIDPETIRRSGHMAKMWVLFDQKSPVTLTVGIVLSNRSQDEYDCSDERTRKLFASFHSDHMAKGVSVYVNSNVKEWQPIPPGSVTEALFKLACDIK